MFKATATRLSRSLSETHHATALALQPNGAAPTAESKLVIQIARSTVEIHRQLAGEIVGLSDDEAADRMAGALKAKKLDTPSLLDRLSTSPLRGQKP